MMLTSIIMGKALGEFVSITKSFLSEDINIIFEIGARYCIDTLAFNKLLPKAKIFTFECNPRTLPVCREAVKNIKNIILIEKAVSDKIGKVKFYPTNPDKTITPHKNGNPGASSLFVVSSKYPKDIIIQDEIEVESIRLKSFLKQNDIKGIDMLWMDIQGAELMALRGLGDYLSKVKLIHTEIEFIGMYEEQPLFKEVKRFLNERNFYLYDFTYISAYFGDAIFINSKILTKKSTFFKLWITDKFMSFSYKKYPFQLRERLKIRRIFFVKYVINFILIESPLLIKEYTVLKRNKIYKGWNKWLLKAVWYTASKLASFLVLISKKLLKIFKILHLGF